MHSMHMMIAFRIMSRFSPLAMPKTISEMPANKITGIAISLRALDI